MHIPHDPSEVLNTRSRSLNSAPFTVFDASAPRKVEWLRGMYSVSGDDAKL